ncbi:MAG TPA: hypothetical protein VNH20_03750 [Candidatus Dormibacteraeota bacterium]|nr:hypothetical protein [Candidatus Dormibacteraeota bacterium]
MDGDYLNTVETYFLRPQARFLDSLDQAIRPLRGRPLLSSRLVLGGLVYMGMEAGPNTLTRLARFYRNASAGQLKRVYGVPIGPTHQHLPAPPPPDQWELYRAYEAIANGLGKTHRRYTRKKREGESDEAANLRWKRRDDRLIRAGRRATRQAANLRGLLGATTHDEAQFELAAQLLVGTAPPQPPGSPYTVDTTDIDADCRPVSQVRMGRGVRAADPDARWRVRELGKVDKDAPRALTASAAKERKKVFGYECITIGGSADNVSYVYAAHCIPANGPDVPVALRLLERMSGDGCMVEEMISDRGYSGGTPWLNGQRSLGIMPTFDLKDAQGARYADFRGCLVLQGWPYLPQLPERLWYLERPGVSAPEWKIKQFRKYIAERQQYALLPFGRPRPDQTRVMSPLARRTKKPQGRLGCPRVPGSMRSRDRTLVACAGEHGDDEACCLKTATFKAAYAPLTHQYPIWGTKDWETAYAKRSNVERGYSTFKNPDVIGLTKGLFHMRGLPSFSLLAACMWVANNLYLRLKAQRDVAKAAQAVVRGRRKHRARHQVPELSAPQPAAGATAPAAPARAP